MEQRAKKVAIARSVHQRLGLSDRIVVLQGRFEDLFDTVFQEYASIDMAFIDGSHHKAPTLAYTDRIAAHAAPNAVFVYDDIRWAKSTDMSDAWDLLRANRRFRVVVDLCSIGIARLAQAPARRYVTPKLSSVMRVS